MELLGIPDGTFTCCSCCCCNLWQEATSATRRDFLKLTSAASSATFVWHSNVTRHATCSELNFVALVSFKKSRREDSMGESRSLSPPPLSVSCSLPDGTFKAERGRRGRELRKVQSQLPDQHKARGNIEVPHRHVMCPSSIPAQSQLPDQHKARGN